MGEGKAAAMSPEERAAILARCEAASPAPWKPRCDHSDDLFGLCNDKDYAEVLSGDETVASFRVRRTSAEVESWCTDPVDKPRVAADIEFIAAARTDVPALLAEVERLERERDAHWANFCERSGDFKKWRAAEAERDAALADAARLRAALNRHVLAHRPDDGTPTRVCGCPACQVCAEQWSADIALLSAPAGDEALREFGRRLIALWTGNRGDAVALEHHLDAVLRGER